MGRPRGSRNKKQAFAFPSESQTPSDAELDKAIDAEETSTPAVESSRKNAATAKVVSSVTEEIFTPEQVAWVFDVYVVSLSFVYSLIFKTDFSVIHSELKLDDDIKIIWAKPLARVASKYAPKEWAGMSAEIELVGCVGIWTATTFQRARNVSVVEKERKKKEEQRRHSQPQNIPQQRTATA